MTRQRGGLSPHQSKASRDGCSWRYEGGEGIKKMDSDSHADQIGLLQARMDRQLQRTTVV